MNSFAVVLRTDSFCLKPTPRFGIAGLRGNSVSARRSLATESLRYLGYICVLNEKRSIDLQNLSPGQSHSAGLMIWITKSYKHVLDFSFEV